MNAAHTNADDQIKGHFPRLPLSKNLPYLTPKILT